MLDVLTQIADVERQLVLQGTEPGIFVPDNLVDQWDAVFQEGRGLGDAGLDDEVVSILVDFDFFLDDVLESLGDTPVDKEAFILYDEVWEDTRELADWTLTRLAFMHSPGEVELLWN
jgi:hypothetical protein